MLADCLCLRDTLNVQINVHKWCKTWIHTSLFTAVCGCISSKSNWTGLFADSRNSSGSAGVAAGKRQLQPHQRVGSALWKHFLQPLPKKMSEKTYYFILVCWKWCIYWNSSDYCEWCSHSAAKSDQEMLKIQQSPCFLWLLLWNTEIMAVCSPCIGLATASPIYENASRKKPSRPNKWLW